MEYYNQKTKTSAWLYGGCAGFNWRDRFTVSISVWDWLAGLSLSRSKCSIHGAKRMFTKLYLTIRIGPISVGGLLYNGIPKAMRS